MTDSATSAGQVRASALVQRRREDMGEAQTPEQAALAPLRVALRRATDRSFYGELVQFGRVIPWR